MSKDERHLINKAVAEELKTMGVDLDECGPLGNIVDVASDEECEKADFVVCMPLGPTLHPSLEDNLTGVCSKCGRQIMFRPNAPTTPPKICYPCFEALMESENG